VYTSWFFKIELVSWAKNWRLIYSPLGWLSSEELVFQYHEENKQPKIWTKEIIKLESFILQMSLNHPEVWYAKR
jgi:hypothetical protein